ncbi:hypothetical protein [Kribbella shirazensis]|uniref:Uncharacterized protein YkwD n=1 Tax=Kribbella shirazensis TaxID=1105143 RepID=A0A7X6A583_9ACTN|nr:hypothetical protein [Kribbella shirazensis]NIK62342.1 uncharacterized protein YkwD [Kribbella shirazensis]
MIALASVVLVITPISWILLHQPQNDDADASLPIVTRTDDTYITPTTKPAVSTPSARVTATPTLPPSATPSATPTSTPSATPSATPTNSPTDSASPTTTPTTRSATTAPTTAPPSTRPTTSTTPGRTIGTTKPTPTTPPPTTTPPPVDGGMAPNEKQLFDLIDNARVSNGCAPLKQDPALTNSARGTAGSRAKTGSGMDDSSGSQVGAGGDRMSAQQAYDRLMSSSRSTILNCGRTTLGVGFGTEERCTLQIITCLRYTDRNVWVANFS